MDYVTKRKKALAKRKLSQTQLAEELGTSRPFVNQLINGSARGWAAELRMAALLDMEHRELFPPPNNYQRAMAATRGQDVAALIEESGWTPDDFENGAEPPAHA